MGRCSEGGFDEQVVQRKWQQQQYRNCCFFQGDLTTSILRKIDFAGVAQREQRTTMQLPARLPEISQATAQQEHVATILSEHKKHFVSS